MISHQQGLLVTCSCKNIPHKAIPIMAQMTVSIFLEIQINLFLGTNISSINLCSVNVVRLYLPVKSTGTFLDVPVHQVGRYFS
jgi:hypothetical protein